MSRLLTLLAALASAFVLMGSTFAQGLVLPGAGAVNRSMAGASTASATDAAGAGDLANENPVPDVATLFNTQVPGISQQQVSLGGSLQMTPAITMDTTVVYGFSSSIEGPLPIPGVGLGRVGIKQDLISLAVSMRFAY